MIGGKYRPREVLGSGATGIVYSVEHTLTGELLALKVMTSHLGGSADAVERFKREARAASKLRSQHVVRIFDADVAPELDNAPYLVMDLLEGVDLEQLSGDKPVEPASVVAWLQQVASPLDKAHRLGIIHRDLKPENLFLTQREDGSPLIKILDFGIAKITAESAGTTQSGQLLGTPLYMAPEQARGDPGQVGPTSDLYALGLIAYKLLAGAPYWTGTSVATILAQILYEPMVAPSARGMTFGFEFDVWFLRACHPDPLQRFTSAVEQMEALAASLGMPADAQAGTSAASVAGTRDSWTPPPSAPPPSGKEPPLAGGEAPPDSNTPAGNDALVLPIPEAPSATVDAPAARLQWGRAAVVVLSACAVIGLLFLALGRADRPRARVFVAQPSPPTGPTAITLADNPASDPGAPSLSAPDLAVAATERPSSSAMASAPTTSASTSDSVRRSALPVAAKREQPHTVRTSASRALTQREKLLIDEALGDQK
jgi:eukaryotic-like serine/threonine-protein kinase